MTRSKTWSLLLHCVIAGLASTAGYACSWDYPIWMIRSPKADPMYRFVRDGKAGYIDSSGRVMIEPKLRRRGNKGGYFFDGLLSLGSGQYMNTGGELELELRLFRGGDFSEGLAVATVTAKGKWGYIDTSGAFAIIPRFEGYPQGNIRPFSDGLAKIDVQGGVGYIDRTGEVVIQPL